MEEKKEDKKKRRRRRRTRRWCWLGKRVRPNPVLKNL